MFRLQCILFLLFVISLDTLCAQQASYTDRIVHEFRLRNHDGRMISLNDFKDARGVVIVFTCNHCPFASLYTHRFNALHKRFRRMRVPFLAINSMDSLVYSDEGITFMHELALARSYRFPYLQDANQSVGKDFGATHTPQSFLISRDDKGMWRIRYAGAIDDNGAEPQKARNHYLFEATLNLIRNREITKKQTSAIGCKIYFRN